MFSGIVEAVGTIEKIEDTGGGIRMRVKAPSILTDAQMGESIAVCGTCLTVVEYSNEWFDVEITQETLRCTTLGGLKTGHKVNLEKALKLSDRLGGHMVTGHVDTVGRISEIKEDGFSKLMKFNLESKWSSFFVKKGSVTVEGVSLTVADCGGLTNNSSSSDSQNEFWFTVALIPHTMDVTTIGALNVGDPVNVETDVIARYVVRLVGESYLENLNKERESVL
ncbi:MAG: riboflavin synthase [Candidatus Melainabacteria bacterium]|nr:riboflavin synthase [Candidatus Melainabacteria bacterium]